MDTIKLQEVTRDVSPLLLVFLLSLRHWNFELENLESPLLSYAPITRINVAT